MSLFSSIKSSHRFGVIFDIGSGSVLAAIVHSAPNQDYPNIIWSHRNHVPLKQIDSIEQSTKAVLTALVEAAMLIDSEGRRALNEYKPGAQITELQCSISAPWSYTITKTINYVQEEEFTISKELISELRETIESKIQTELNEEQTLQDMGLQIITKLTTNLSANGYNVVKPSGNRAKSLTLSQTNSVAQEYLVDVITELQEKILTKAKTRKISFILMLYSMAKELLSNPREVCLVDVTYEATEIGIVRGGVLTYCTHTAFGLFSLAREISKITKVPIHEAFGYLNTDKPYSFIESLNRQQQTDVERVFEAYTEKISDLFDETGDSLSIPKQISLHSELSSEPLLTDLIQKAGKRKLKTLPHVTSMTRRIIEKYYTNLEEPPISKDTALLLSAQFFHNKAKRSSYEYF